jgi:hypothetical protein
MWPTRSARLEELDRGLLEFSRTETSLKGIPDRGARRTLAEQMIASLRRLHYTEILKGRDIHPDRANPESNLFDPERAALLFARNGDRDEGIWLIFLSIHFGKHRVHGWRMVRDIYSGLGSGRWTWQRVSSKPNTFRDWLRANRERIGGAFGNHRKYETLDPDSRSSSATVIESCVDLLKPSPSSYFDALVRSIGNDPHRIFEAAYQRLAIVRFGRLARFDFLSLLGRMDLAPLEPGSTYLRGATGPLQGARLLIDGDSRSSSSEDDLDEVLRRLDRTLNVGMQVMEDSICNWQKSPRKFIHFRG